jgi:hypothetical protein
MMKWTTTSAKTTTCLALESDEGELCEEEK